MARFGESANNIPQLTSQQALNSAIWSICDIRRCSNCAGDMQYVPELTWILFLRIFSKQGEMEAQKAEAVGEPRIPSRESPYRWRDWTVPYDHSLAGLMPCGRGSRRLPGLEPERSQV